MIKVSLFKDEDAMSTDAARMIVELSHTAIEKSGRFVIALSGGKTPALLYNLLSHLPFSKELHWKKIFVFWSDERCVPADDEQNNSNMARRMLLEHVPIPTENIFAVQVQMPAEKAAIQYEQMLNAFFKEEIPSFDLILLGMGEDGHTASLFPGTEKYWTDTQQLVTAIEIPEQKIKRITFTPTLINNAKQILILVSGKTKATVLQKILEDKSRKKTYPIQYIRPNHGKLMLFAEKAAASELKHA